MGRLLESTHFVIIPFNEDTVQLITRRRIPTLLKLIYQLVVNYYLHLPYIQALSQRLLELMINIPEKIVASLARYTQE